PSPPRLQFICDTIPSLPRPRRYRSSRETVITLRHLPPLPPAAKVYEQKDKAFLSSPAAKILKQSRNEMSSYLSARILKQSRDVYIQLSTSTSERRTLATRPPIALLSPSLFPSCVDIEAVKTW
ncbi:hypothetical protein HJC23_000406, partial [Cyclotella cryptica]